MDPSPHSPQANTDSIVPRLRPDPTSLELESTLLTLFQSLTEMQVAAGSVQPTKEGLAAGAASRTLDSLFQLAEMKPRIIAKIPMEVLETKTHINSLETKLKKLLGRISIHMVNFNRSHLLEKSLLDNFPELLRDEHQAAGPANDHHAMKVEEPMR